MGWVGTNALETVPPRHSDFKHKDCMTPLALRDFKPGQRFYFRKPLSPGFTFFCMAEFIRVEKGYVYGKIVENEWQPSWMDIRSLERTYPDRIVRLKPTTCCIYGKGRDINKHCHWFRDLDHPVEDMVEQSPESIEWMEKLLAAPATKNLLTEGRKSK